MKRLPPRRWKTTWCLETRGYRLFMLRELTAFFVGAYVIFMLVVLARLGGDAAAFDDFARALASPLSIGLHLLALAAAVYHSITWFNISPRITPPRIGDDPLPDALVSVGFGYLPWGLVTVVILWAVLR